MVSASYHTKSTWRWRGDGDVNWQKRLFQVFIHSHKAKGLLLAAERAIFYKVGPTCLALLAEFFDTTGATSGGRSTVPICLVNFNGSGR